MRWQQELQESFKTVADLLTFLELPLDNSNYLPNPSFPIKVPRSFAARMKKRDWKDPLLSQVLPIMAELEDQHGSLDPLMEADFSEQRGILQKFQHRLLVIASGHCAVNCRYCFRRHFPYDQHRFSTQDWIALFERVRNDPSLIEVILSGGDPLTLSDERLDFIIKELNTIEHLEVIRFHTRFPVVIPARLTPGLLQVIKNSRVPIIIVLHINHAQEIDHKMKLLLRSWQQAGCIFMNQAVLLKDVNDTVEAQEALWRTCFQAGVLAYYLHHFDDVKQAKHFEVGKTQGLQLMNELRLRLPGYMVPSYVQEVPHAGAKVPLK